MVVIMWTFYSPTFSSDLACYLAYILDPLASLSAIWRTKAGLEMDYMVLVDWY